MALTSAKSADKVKGLSTAGLTKMREAAAAAVADPLPADGYVTDHRKAKNPYQSLYGDGWEKICDATVFMQKFVSVQDMVLALNTAGRDVFRGTPHGEWHEPMALELKAMCKVRLHPVPHHSL